MKIRKRFKRIAAFTAAVGIAFISVAVAEAFTSKKVNGVRTA